MTKVRACLFPDINDVQWLELHCTGWNLVDQMSLVNHWICNKMVAVNLTEVSPVLLIQLILLLTLLLLRPLPAPSPRLLRAFAAHSPHLLRTLSAPSPHLLNSTTTAMLPCV